MCWAGLSLRVLVVVVGWAVGVKGVSGCDELVLFGGGVTTISTNANTNANTNFNTKPICTPSMLNSSAFKSILRPSLF